MNGADVWDHTGGGQGGKRAAAVVHLLGWGGVTVQIDPLFLGPVSGTDHQKNLAVTAAGGHPARRDQAGQRQREQQQI